MSEISLKKIGKVTHFFTNIGVAVVELNERLVVGDKIRIQGLTTDVEQDVNSMQIEHKNINAAESGQSVGLKVEGRVREGDIVYKVS